MLSISFLPWVILLAFTLLSVPIVAVVESQRRKKARGPAPAEDAGADQEEAEMPEMAEDLAAADDNVEEVAFAEASDDDDDLFG